MERERWRQTDTETDRQTHRHTQSQERHTHTQVPRHRSDVTKKRAKNCDTHTQPRQTDRQTERPVGPADLLGGVGPTGELDARDAQPPAPTAGERRGLGRGHLERGPEQAALVGAADHAAARGSLTPPNASIQNTWCRGVHASVARFTCSRLTNGPDRGTGISGSRRWAEAISVW